MLRIGSYWIHLQVFEGKAERLMKLRILGSKPTKLYRTPE
jgi:hypothetical protein